MRTTNLCAGKSLDSPLQQIQSTVQMISCEYLSSPFVYGVSDASAAPYFYACASDKHTFFHYTVKQACIKDLQTCNFSFHDSFLE